MNYIKIYRWKIILLVGLSIIFFISCKKENVDLSPECEILKPAEGDVYLPGEEIPITINASDQEGKLEKLDIYINDQLVYTCYNSPCDIYWKSWGTSLGNYTIKAIATDGAGNEVSKQINIKLQSGIVYDNILYGLDFGVLEYYGKATTSTCNFGLNLLSSSVISSSQGNVIFIGIFSSSSLSLDIGEYTFDATSSGTKNSFDYAEFAVDYNFTSNVGQNGKAIGGIVMIDEYEDIYKIFVNTNTNTGKPVIAYYEGLLQYVDQSSKNNASRYSTIFTGSSLILEK